MPARLRNLSSRLWPYLLVCVSLAASANPFPVVAQRLLGTSGPETGSGPRDNEPVIVGGALFADLAGRPLSELALFVYSPSEPGYVPVPFQWDERINKVFNEGTELEFAQLVYDVFGEDDQLLDNNDELAFMFRDAGPRAPSKAPWPDGAEPQRYEIRVVDTRPGVGNADRWAYLFSGVGLPHSPDSYVDWNQTPSGQVSSARFEIDYTDRWLLTGLSLTPPCGDGLDLIDRFKGRAEPVPGNVEDEEGWNSNSSYLGGRLGPVRAIRGVRGATSAINTLHFDVIYSSFWERQVTLRVHPLDRAWFYFDWLPRSPATLYTPLHRDGLVIDGVPDPEASSVFSDWNVMTGKGGGIGVVFDVPDSPLYSGKQAYLVDDASYNDEIATNPGYGDDDDALIGGHGVTLLGISETNLDGIPLTLRVYPLCDGEGSAQLGDAIEDLQNFPITAEAEPGWVGASPVRGLVVQTSGSDLLLSWAVDAEADFYRIYRSPDPSLLPETWTLVGETASPNFLDAGAAIGPDRYYYSIVAVSGTIEGPW